ncbi:MAG: hypothetical protein ACRC33_02375 [Gemmataceae bacterium]
MTGVEEELSRDADKFHALRPLSPESYCFWYDYPHPVTGAVYTFDFVVSGHGMEQGVVVVAYFDLTVTRVF